MGDHPKEENFTGSYKVSSYLQYLPCVTTTDEDKSVFADKVNRMQPSYSSPCVMC